MTDNLYNKYLENQDKILEDLKYYSIGQVAEHLHTKKHNLVEFLQLIDYNIEAQQESVAQYKKEQLAISRAKKHLENIDVNELLDYFSNHSLGVTAEKFHMRNTTLETILKILEVSLHTKEEELAFSIENRKQSVLENYGVENISQLQEVKDKIKANTDYSLVIENTKQSKLIKYGDPYYNNREKAKQTCIDKFGVDSYWKTEESKSNNRTKKRNLVYAKFESILSDKDLVDYYSKNSTHTLALLLHSKTNTVKDYLAYKGIPVHTPEQDYKFMSDNIASICIEKYDLPYWAMRIESQKENGICRGKRSEPESKLDEELTSKGLEFEPEYYLDKRYFDYKIDNTLLELNPTATHNINWSPYGTPIEKDYHKIKSELAKTHGFDCIHIWDWDNKEALYTLLDKNKITVGARKCELLPVDNKLEEEFLNKYHFQGYAKSKLALGLFYQNELVSIMTFGKPRYNKNVEWELIRYCSKANITGGAEKLFSKFLEITSAKSVVSYCDLSKFSGKVYSKLGFTLKSISEPARHWYNIKTKTHITENLLRQRGFDQLFGTSYGKGSSNEDLMLVYNFLEVYDCGQATYL